MLHITVTIHQSIYDSYINWIQNCIKQIHKLLVFNNVCNNIIGEGENLSSISSFLIFMPNYYLDEKYKLRKEDWSDLLRSIYILLMSVIKQFKEK